MANQNSKCYETLQRGPRQTVRMVLGMGRVMLSGLVVGAFPNIRPKDLRMPPSPPPRPSSKRKCFAVFRFGFELSVGVVGGKFPLGLQLSPRAKFPLNGEQKAKRKEMELLRVPILIH